MGKKILIADENETNREVLFGVFEGEYEPIEKEDGLEALKAVIDEQEDLIAVILDSDLPQMDGYTVTEKIKEKDWGKNIPVVIISDDTSLKAEKRAYKSGAAFFSKKPFDQMLIKDRITELSELYQARANAKSLKVSGAPQNGAAEGDKDGAVTDINKIFDSIIEFLGRLVESRDPENRHHIYRIKGLVRIMAKTMQELYPEYELGPVELQMIETACSIHDIGKVAIPDSIILKPGRLTNDEYEYMKSHTLRGVELFEEIGFEWDPKFAQIAKDIIRSHHEKYDGGGYPDALKGDDIPIAAQIVSLADTYDALTNDRVYRKAFSMDEAYNMIVMGDTGVFPPKILECFKTCRKELEAWENDAAKKGLSTSGS